MLDCATHKPPSVKLQQAVDRDDNMQQWLVPMAKWTRLVAIAGWQAYYVLHIQVYGEVPQTSGGPFVCKNGVKTGGDVALRMWLIQGIVWLDKGRM